MKIFSIRSGFHVDHSSTSYEFYAVDKPLNSSGRKAVASLSSRARPSGRRVSFIYHGEWNDLPCHWRQLMEKYYDVMYSESYDWWTLAMAFTTDQKKVEKIKRYEFSGIEDLGVTISSKANRVIVSIHCRLSPGVDFEGNYYDYDEEEEDIEFENKVESDNSLLNLLAENREYLKNGDYRLLYGVWQKYGFNLEGSEGLEDESPPKTLGMDKLPQPIKYLLGVLETLD